MIDRLSKLVGRSAYPAATEARLIDQQKRKQHFYRTLIKRGVSSKAAAVAFTNRKRWALSKTVALSRAYPNDWFIKGKGQAIRSDQKLASFSMGEPCVRSRVRTRSHGSVGRRRLGLLWPDDVDFKSSRQYRPNGRVLAFEFSITSRLLAGFHCIQPTGLFTTAN